MSAFVGQNRRAIVDELLIGFDSCVDGRRPQLRVLTAEAGWGKTRIVHEFYRRLQGERQQTPHYWPSELAAGDDVMRARKQVRAPNPGPSAGAILPWLWWGLRCEEDEGGRRVRAVHNDREQLSAHLAGLIAADEQRRGDKALWLETATAALAFIPGVGQVVTGLKAYNDLSPLIKERINRSFQRPTSFLHDRERPLSSMDTASALAAVEGELELVRRFVSRRLPLVLVIDDAHHADPLTVTFMNELLRLAYPVFIIATAWPSVIEDQATAEVDLRRDDRQTFGGMVAAVRHHHDVVEHRLDPLTREAVHQLVSEVLPAATQVQMDALAEACDGNPLVLRLQLTSGRVRRTVQGGAIQLHPDELRRLPRRFEQLVAERFSDLNEATQSWLAEAALQGQIFFPTMMMNSAEGIDLELSKGFCREVATSELSSWRFIEMPVYTAVRRIAVDDYDDSDFERWTAATRSAIVAWWLDNETGLPADIDAHLAWCRLSSRLVAAPPGVEERAAFEAPTAIKIALHHSWAARDAGEHDEELAAAEQAVSWGKYLDATEVDTALWAQVRLSHALCATNQPERAAEIARAARNSTNTPTSPVVIFDLHYAVGLALSQAEVDLAEAERECKGALDVARERLDASFVIAALRALAVVYSKMSLTSNAQSAIQEALDIAHTDMPKDLALHFDLQTDLVDIGPDALAAEPWTHLMASSAETLGTDHWLWRYCRDNLILALLSQGNYEQADAVEDEHGRPEAQSAIGHTIAMLRGLALGDVSGFSSFLEYFKSLPYLTRSDRDFWDENQWISLLLTEGGVQQDELPPLLTDVFRQATSDPDLALDRILESVRGNAGNLEVLQATSLALPILLDAGSRGKWLGDKLRPVLSLLERKYKTVLAQEPMANFVRLIDDITNVYDGGDPELEAAILPPAIRCDYLSLRGVAWHRRGKVSASGDDLRDVRTLLPLLKTGRDQYIRAAQAHRACADEGEIEVLRGALELLPGGPPERVDRLAALGDALYRRQLFDEAIEVEREGLELLRTTSDRNVAAPRRRLLWNLTSSLDMRGRSEDLAEIIALRRELLDVLDDGLNAIVNRYRLAGLLEDWPSFVAAASELASFPVVGAQERSRALNELSVVLARLGRRDLAIKASIAALATVEDPASAAAQTATKNLHALHATTREGIPSLLRDELRREGFRDSNSVVGEASGAASVVTSGSPSAITWIYPVPERAGGRQKQSSAYVTVYSDTGGAEEGRNQQQPEA